MASWKNSRMLRFKWCKLDSRWWQLKYFLFTPDPWGNDPFWQAYFSNGLKPPTRIVLGQPWPEKLRVFLKDGSRWGGNGAQPTAGPVECRVRRQRCGTASDEVKTGRVAIGQGLRSWAQQLQRLKVPTLFERSRWFWSDTICFCFLVGWQACLFCFMFSGKRFFFGWEEGNTSSFANLIVLARNWLLFYQFMMTVYVFFFNIDWS